MLTEVCQLRMRVFCLKTHPDTWTLSAVGSHLIRTFFWLKPIREQFSLVKTPQHYSSSIICLQQESWAKQAISTTSRVCCSREKYTASWVVERKEREWSYLPISGRSLVIFTVVSVTCAIIFAQDWSLPGADILNLRSVNFFPEAHWKSCCICFPVT